MLNPTGSSLETSLERLHSCCSKPVRGILPVVVRHWNPSTNTYGVHTLRVFVLLAIATMGTINPHSAPGIPINEAFDLWSLPDNLPSSQRDPFVQ